ncbi:autotransporter outer membrane beta-barrel domain-containing protein [Citrobacter telavivensis]
MKIKSLTFLSAIACYIPVALAATTKGYEIKEQTVVGNGGVIENATIINPGTLFLKGDATSNNITVESGGHFFIINGMDYSSTIEAGGSQYVRHGLAIKTTVRGTQEVHGETESVNIDGGTQEIRSSGRAFNTYITNGGTQHVEGHAILTKIADGIQNVKGGGVAESTTVRGKGYQYVAGTAIHSELYDSSELHVVAGGRALHTRLYHSSKGFINEDGTAEKTTLNDDSSLYLKGGTVESADIFDGSFYAETGKAKGDFNIHGGQMVLYKEAMTETANVKVGGQGTLRLNAGAEDVAYSLKALQLDGGKVYLHDMPVSKSSGWNTLTLDTLEGKGDFYMQTNVSAWKSDLLDVTGNASGAFNVFVEDTGSSPDKDQSLLLVKTASGDATFALGNKDGVVDLGTYQYTLKEKEEGKWSLIADLTQKPEPEQPGQSKPEPNPDTPSDSVPVVKPQPEIVKKRITPSTAAVLNMAAVEPLVFDAELDSVRERMDGRDSFSRDGVVWSTVYNTRDDVSTSAGAGFDHTLSGVTIGADRHFQHENSGITTGGFFSYSHSNVGFDRGGKGNVDSYALGAYASWQHNNGLYVDGIVKVNRFENDVKGRMTGGGAANGSYSAYGAGAHLESGMRLSAGDLGITPYAAFTGFTTDSNKYTLSNGMRAEVGNTRIARAEAGLKTDYHVTLNNGVEIQPWVKAAVRREYADDNKVNVNDDGHFVNDLSGTRGVYQAGIRAKFTEDLSGHLSASYGNGANVESPWRAAAGISWSF